MLSMPSPWMMLVAVGVLLLLYGIFAPERVRLEGFRRPPLAPDVPAPSGSNGEANGFTISLVPHVHAPIPSPLPEPAIAAAEAPPVAPAPVEPQWPLLFDPNAVGINPVARKNIVVALGALSEEWCAPIIAAAYCDDPVSEVRAAGRAAFRARR